MDVKPSFTIPIKPDLVIDGKRMPFLIIFDERPKVARKRPSR